MQIAMEVIRARVKAGTPLVLDQFRIPFKREESSSLLFQEESREERLRRDKETAIRNVEKQGTLPVERVRISRTEYLRRQQEAIPV